MASWAEGRLQDPGYKRFILACLAWDWLCKQLEPYLTHVIEDLHSDLITNGHTVPVCHTNASTYKEVKACLLVACGSSVRLLENCHVGGSLRQCWRNSQIDRWEKQPWSLALLYMDPGKDPTTNLTPGDTDISGVINLMQHCTRFNMNKILVEKIRVQRNKSVHHSSTFEIKETEFNDLIDDISNLLSDPCVAPHVTGNVVTYLDNVKNMKIDITFHDEITAIRQTLVKVEQRQAEKFEELIDKHDDLKKALSEELSAIKHILNLNAPESTSDCIQKLKKELIKCYSRPEFCHLNPFLDENTLGYFIESVFVDVSLAKRTIQPIVGKRGLEDSIRQHGTPVSNVSDMIPSPGGDRVLLTGFVGSGKTSLCLHWVHTWCNGKSANNNLNRFDLVVFLRARALEKSIQRSLATILEGINQQFDQKERQINDMFLLQPPTLIIIDGYDEATEQQQNIVDDIVSYKTLPHASVIITSRPNFFHGKIAKWYDNLGFKKEQQLAFIEQFKLTINKDQVQLFEKFEHKFIEDKNAGSIFISPMMAMTTCCMVAAGEVVTFESRVNNYQQLTDFLEKRACFKNENLTQVQVKQARPDLCRAAYNQMLQKKVFHFTRDELLEYTTTSMLDTIIVHLGYLSVTKYIFSHSIDTAYTFVHKSWAEFIAAQYLMTLNISDRCEAVCQLFKSGPSNQEVLKFTLGLCGANQPENMALLFKAIFKIVGTNLDINDKVFRQETETIQANDYNAISRGSQYLLLLLTEVDSCALPGAAARDLSWVCAAVWRAEIGEEVVRERTGIDINIDTDLRMACPMYARLLLTTHRTQGTLHTVQEVTLSYWSGTPYSVITDLPATLVACAPRMTALTLVHVRGFKSSTELGELCDGLVGSGLPCLTHLTLGSGGELLKEGEDLGPVVRVIRKAAKLRELTLHQIHCRDEGQLSALCAAFGEAAPQLTCLVFENCRVKLQQYSALLVPALRKRLTARGTRLLPALWDWLTARDGRLRKVQMQTCNGTRKEMDELEQELREVAVNVSVT